MVELEKKYEIGVRRFGFVNWIGVWTLYKKEVLRFFNVIGQTILGPIVTAGLFISNFISYRRGKIRYTWCPLY